MAGEMPAISLYAGQPAERQSLRGRWRFRAPMAHVMGWYFYSFAYRSLKQAWRERVVGVHPV